MTVIVRDVQAKTAGLTGRPRILITGGPTCEDLDAVRFLTNRSTGRMGIEVAQMAAASGAAVLLVLGPTHLAVSDGVGCVRVRSAQEMHDAVHAAFAWCDILIMTAAVADYTPVQVLDGKMKKGEGNLILELKRTPDILKSVAAREERSEKVVIGFALEKDLDLDEAFRKLTTKKLDGIIANTAASFGAEAAASACYLGADGTRQDLGAASKTEIARTLIEKAQAILFSRS